MSDSLLVQVTVLVFAIMWATFGRVMAWIERTRQQRRTAVSAPTSDQRELLEPTQGRETRTSLREVSHVVRSDDRVHDLHLYDPAPETTHPELTDVAEETAEPTHLVEGPPFYEERLAQDALATDSQRRFRQDALNPVRQRNTGTRRSASARSIEDFREAFKLMLFLAPPRALEPKARSGAHDP